MRLHVLVHHHNTQTIVARPPRACVFPFSSDARGAPPASPHARGRVSALLRCPGEVSRLPICFCACTHGIRLSLGAHAAATPRACGGGRLRRPRLGERSTLLPPSLPPPHADICGPTRARVGWWADTSRGAGHMATPARHPRETLPLHTVFRPQPAHRLFLLW